MSANIWKGILYQMTASLKRLKRRGFHHRCENRCAPGNSFRWKTAVCLSKCELLGVPGSQNSHYKTFCGCRSLPGAKNGAHLEIHFTDKQRFAIPGVKAKTRVYGFVYHIQVVECHDIHWGGGFHWVVISDAAISGNSPWPCRHLQGGSMFPMQCGKPTWGTDMLAAGPSGRHERSRRLQNILRLNIDLLCCH